LQDFVALHDFVDVPMRLFLVRQGPSKA